jgi:WD40 repeat protein
MPSSEPRSLRVLDVESGEWAGPLRVAHRGTTGWVFLAPDGATFVTGGSDGAIGLWEGRTGAPLSKVVPAGRTSSPAR